MVASNARKNFGFLHISFYKVVQIVLPIIEAMVEAAQETNIKRICAVTESYNEKMNGEI